MFVSLLVISSYKNRMLSSHTECSPPSIFLRAIQRLNWIVRNGYIIGHGGHLGVSDATADPKLIRLGVEDNIVISVFQVFTDSQCYVFGERSFEIRMEVFETRFGWNCKLG